MSHNNIIQAVKIKILPASPGLPEHTELGVYVNEDDTQEIRWSEMPLTNCAQTWKSGIIAQKGIGDIERGADTRRGGAPEEYNGLTIIVLNNNQLILRLKELGITVNGLTAEVHEFIGAPDVRIGGQLDSDSVEHTIRFTGVCEYETGSTWNENIWAIQIKNGRFQRNACLATPINNDAINGNFKNATDDKNGMIPLITIGEHLILPAKLLRTAGKQTSITNNDLKTTTGKYCTPEGLQIFPVIANLQGWTQIATNYVYVYDMVNYVNVGDELTIHNGFPVNGENKTVTGKGTDYITVDGDAATSSSFTNIDLNNTDSTETKPCLTYVIKIGTGKVGTRTYPSALNDGQNFIESLVGKWIQVVLNGSVDNVSLVGKYRKITAFMLNFLRVSDDDLINVTIVVDKFFEKNLSGNGTATATNNAWISFLDLPFEYRADIWPCAGFLDTEGNIIERVAKLLYYDDTNKKLREIASYGYDVDISDLSNAKLILDAKLFENDPETLVSFDIFPLINLAKYLASTLASWELPTRLQIAGSNLYSVDDTGFPPAIDSNSDISGDNWHNQDDSNYLNLIIQVHKTEYYMHELWAAYEAEIDFAKILIEYESYYLGVNCWTRAGTGSSTYDNSWLRIMMRRFIGTSLEILSYVNGEKYRDDMAGGSIANLPDFYFINRTSPDNNEAFSYEKTLLSIERNLKGYKLFQMTGITSIAQLKSIFKIGLLFDTRKDAVGYSEFNKTIHLNELALICKSTCSIKDALYSYFAGRTFNSTWGIGTWGPRKIATDLITNPVDILEHFKRLQCGIEFGEKVDFGKVYSTLMPIKTYENTEGSYDDASLAGVKEFTPAYQITDANDAWTDVQIKNICSTFNLCTYTDNAGYECVTTLDLTNPAETVAFTDIVPGSIGETKEPEVQDVFCQPNLNYQYNPGSEKFDKQLSIQNIQADAWTASYTPGFDPAGHNLDATLFDGEYVWTQCKELYGKYRQIEQVPKEFSDQKMIMTYVDAVKLLSMKVAWMGKPRVPLAVFYSKGKDYFYGKHIKIKLPHQTCNQPIECFIEKIKISKNKNRADLNLVVLEEVPTFFF